MSKKYQTPGGFFTKLMRKITSVSCVVKEVMDLASFIIVRWMVMIRENFPEAVSLHIINKKLSFN